MSNPVRKPDPEEWESLVDSFLTNIARERAAESARPADAGNFDLEPPRSRGSSESSFASPNRGFARWVHSLGVPALGAAVAILIGTWASAPRPALTPDSLQYLSAAQNMAAGHGVVTSVTELDVPNAREPLSIWPPLYPFLLSVGTQFMGHGQATVGEVAAHPGPPAPIEWARWFNLACLALTFFPLAALARLLVGPGWALGVVAFYAIFRPPVLAASFVWSETLFTLLTVTSLALLVRGLRRNGEALDLAEQIADDDDDFRSFEPERLHPKSKETPEILYYVAAGFMAGLATLTRYAGFAVLAAGFVAIVMRTETTRARPVLRRLIAFTLPGLLPVLAWTVRNAIVAGAPFGAGRGGANFGPETAILDLLRTLLHDLVLPRAFLDGQVQRIAEIGGAAMFVFLLFALVQRFGPQAVEENRARHSAVVSVMAFVVVYGILMFVTSLQVDTDHINTRLLSPAYPALAVLAALALRSASLGHDRRWMALVLVAVVYFGAFHGAATLRYATAARETNDLTKPYWRSVVWGDPAWRDRPEMTALAALPADAVILSNVWERVAIATNRPVKPLPRKGERGWAASILRASGAYVLVDHTTRGDFVGQAELDQIGVLPPGIVPLVEMDGVTLYKVRTRFDEPMPDLRPAHAH